MCKQNWSNIAYSVKSQKPQTSVLMLHTLGVKRLPQCSKSTAYRRWTELALHCTLHNIYLQCSTDTDQTTIQYVYVDILVRVHNCVCVKWSFFSQAGLEGSTPGLSGF